jgi:lipopolysaccharide export system protein LptC
MHTTSAALSKLRSLLSESLTYAPLILMSLLALGTFALFKQVPALQSDQQSQKESLPDDYFLGRFYATEYLPTGAAKSLVVGVSAQHNTVTKVLTVEGIEFSANSTSSFYQGSAKQGAISDDGKTITLVGQAVIEQEKIGALNPSRSRFKSDYMVLRQDPDSIEAVREAKLEGRVEIMIESGTQ